MSDTVKRALDLVSGYQDAPHPKMKDWDWRPLKDVRADLDGLPEIPSHVEAFGSFMDETARRAIREGLTPRDLIKAYAITRSSIQRRAQDVNKVRAAGLDLPPGITGMIRPEGAMGEWLHSREGQRYLDAAERGKVDHDAVAHAQQVMKPFGLMAETDALPWAVEHLAPRHKEVSDLVGRALTGKSPPEEWRKFSEGMRGIGTAKAGFVASMMGRGDQPTLDARQVVLQTGKPTAEAKGPMRRAGYAAVDRLADRQAALDPKMDGGLEPFRQHLTHHAIWDKAGDEVTTHDDVIRAMRHAKNGGRIGYADGGGNMDHPMANALLTAIHGSADKAMVRRALEASKTTGFTRTGAGLMQRDPRLQAAPPKLSGIKLSSKSGHLIKPFDELSADFAPKNNLMPSKEADIEGMQREGAYLRPLVGDKTPADTVLMGHNGAPLVEPVNQQGGGDYTRSEFAEGDQPTGWRSRERAAKGFQNRVGAGVPKGAPVYGAHVAMGDVSGDSSHMLLHAAIHQVPNLPIKKEYIAKFDEEMRKKFPHDEKFPMPWPGILNTQAVHDFFYNQPSVVRGKKGMPDTIRPQARPGTHIAAFVKNMDSVRWQNAGFPNIASARFANLVPDLMAEPQGATGYGITQLDPDAPLVADNETRAHGTYTHGLPTKGYAGRFTALVPASEIWKEDLKNAKNPTELQYTLATKFPAAKVDQRIVDLVRGAQEERKSRWGFNTGGAVVAKPTEAQKQAGNYRKAHYSYHGLPVTIETPRGQKRSGVDPQGKAWSVKMPYDYGYIKRTEGADGDHVDVGIGRDHASDHVFIVDQCDLRGQFDEHKVLLGYRTREEAVRDYNASFSDGSGPQRMKTVVRMSMPEFKRWLKEHDTTKPLRGQGHIDRAMALTSRYNSPHRDAGQTP